MPIINSILDTDLYKLTMAQAVLHQFPETHVKFKFKCPIKEILFKYNRYFFGFSFTISYFHDTIILIIKFGG